VGGGESSHHAMCFVDHELTSATMTSSVPIPSAVDGVKTSPAQDPLQPLQAQPTSEVRRSQVGYVSEHAGITTARPNRNCSALHRTMSDPTTSTYPGPTVSLPGLQGGKDAASPRCLRHRAVAGHPLCSVLKMHLCWSTARTTALGWSPCTTSRYSWY
jgi:hypothetical protein